METQVLRDAAKEDWKKAGQWKLKDARGGLDVRLPREGFALERVRSRRRFWFRPVSMASRATLDRSSLGHFAPAARNFQRQTWSRREYCRVQTNSIKKEIMQVGISQLVMSEAPLADFLQQSAAANYEVVELVHVARRRPHAAFFRRRIAKASLKQVRAAGLQAVVDDA